jgi:aryl-alcohol dehydrogenase-like predicted oxidoreductase
MAAPPAPRPSSLLGYHRILSPLAGVRVSPLCLGTMNFGEFWKGSMGECSKETAFEILDTFYENGGNFIDTANFYQGEDSEKWVGEWIAKRKNRDELVVATKYTMGYRGMGPEKIKSNFQGNHAKSLKLSVDASLKKMQTDYIDLLYAHIWDFTTSVEELMTSLNNLVVNGKVLYLGITGAPAWVVVKCNACEWATLIVITRC